MPPAKRRRKTASRLCLATVLLLSDLTGAEAGRRLASPPPSSPSSSSSPAFLCPGGSRPRHVRTDKVSARTANRRYKAIGDGGKPGPVPASHGGTAEAAAAARTRPSNGGAVEPPPPLLPRQPNARPATVTTTASRSIHLISLPPKTDLSPPSVRSAWKWKDSALGDGRDYFVPRPRALGALNELLVGTVLDLPQEGRGGRQQEEEEEEDGIDGGGGGGGRVEIEECGVLSNCARLDVVLVVSCRPAVPGGESTDNARGDERASLASLAARKAVGDALASQLASYAQRSTNAALSGLASFLDMPGVVETSPPPLSPDAEATRVSDELTSALVQLEGCENIARHLCRVAAGMAERPSRPGRDVPFRPYSSRDAHVMLQIKRTAEVASGARVRAVFDASLQAGKAARDPDRVPDIVPLRGYGTDGRYASEAPAALTDAAVQAATVLAIDPAIERCRSRLIAMDAADVVSSFRQRVEDEMRRFGVDVEGEEGLTVRRFLHRPCMELREGRTVDEAEIVRQICDGIGIGGEAER